MAGSHSEGRWLAARRSVSGWGWAALLVAAGVGAQAPGPRVLAVSPQGEVGEVRQVSVRFDQAVVPAGDPFRPAPFRLSCNGRAPAGDGRWADAQRWLFDLREPLSAGQRCTLRADPAWAPLAGALQGPAEFRFSTGAPVVLSVLPDPASDIDEDQHFLLQLSGAVVPASVAASAWCEVDGIGDRLPLRLVEGAARERLLKHHNVKAAAAPNWLLLACQKPLPAETRVRLVWGAGIVAAAEPSLRTRKAQSFQWTVRPRFSAEFTCERERASAPCLPLRPMGLRFSAPVSRTAALAARLTPAGGTPIAPKAEDGSADGTVSALRFAAPLPENTRFKLSLPAGLQDDAGRPLSNAGSFPLEVATGDFPPLAKFAGAPFGIVEAGPQAILPLTLRHVQADLQGASTGGRVAVRRLDASTPDAELHRWITRLARHHEQQISAKEAGLPASMWTVTEEVADASGRLRKLKRERFIGTREVSLLAGDTQARRSELPAAPGGPTPRATEVLGLPLPLPGYHVVEVESRILGDALLASRAPMYVRTGALVTQFAVHFKRGRTSSLVWVTTLDRARPVAGAAVAVNDCNGKPLWNGLTDERGIAAIARGFDDPAACAGSDGLFVTARAGPAGQQDLSFVFSGWNRGIEPWRFNLPTAAGSTPDRRAHTVFDRTLLRAGEVVAMKHYVREDSERGLSLPAADTLPDTLVLTHVGSGDEVEQPLVWRGAGRASESRWAIPKSARLGLYDVALKRGADRSGQRWPSGSFRVEAFTVPLVDARLSGPAGTLVAPKALPLALQLQLLAGGPLASEPVQVSALLRRRDPGFAGFEDYSFAPPSAAEAVPTTDGDRQGDSGERLVADRLTATTDRQGAATLSIENLPALDTPSELLAEASFNDPNGELQTVSQRLALWPSAVVVGIRAMHWAGSRGAAEFSAVLLDTAGRSLKGREIEVLGRHVQTHSARKRIVGGFYAWDNQREVRELGVLCSARSDARGRIECHAPLDLTGEVELVARARDDAGRVSQAATSVWIAGAGEQWFAQDNDDRIELWPEQREVEPGATARLQVRMPFREATALVTVEREGVLDSRVVTLRGSNPVVEVVIPKAADGGVSWAPNVIVSVLVQRARLREVPLSSFFRWGWRDPADWWRAWRYERPDHRPPTASVDLARPSFKLGAAQLKVGTAAHRLDVKVTPEKAVYGVRETVRTKVSVSHRGQPAAGAEIAFAAVDEGLLALQPNRSWDLLDAMMMPRPWGVETASAMGEIIGRRHYGRKALAPGGGGGRNPTRELFDTLLLWQGSVVLDARGEAWVDVPLNDSLTSFRLVAVADAGVDRFGTGSASVRVSQDLQVYAGLPALVRDGDRFDAAFTLRNSTAAPMTVAVTLNGEAQVAGKPVALALAPQTLTLAAGLAAEPRWAVEVPAGAERIVWSLQAAAQAPVKASDRLRVVQAVLPAVPPRVWQSTLQPLAGTLTVPLAPPAGAVPGGGVSAAVLPRLAGDLPGVRRFFETYAYSCLEQTASKAIALRDPAAWVALRDALPGYLDSDGLAAFFPPGPQDAPRGSDRLTAHLLSAAHEAGLAWPEPSREAMLRGLAAFVEGRLLRPFNAPRDDRDVRKWAALEALSRHGRATPRMLGSIAWTPAAWPTAALLDAWAVLRRLDAAPDRAARLDEVQRLLRSRLQQGGPALRFSTEASDGWWWLMDSADANAARLLLAATEVPAWRDDVPMLVTGLLGRQQRGAWSTTTANLWGSLALARYAERFEALPVSGRSSLQWAAVQRSVEPSASGAPLLLPWPPAAASLVARHEGSGRPWLSLQSLAAVPLAAPVAAGYAITRSIVAVQRQNADTWTRGDVLRVRIEIEAATDMGWVMISDPLPAGAVVMGGGLARDSALAARGERREGNGWLAFEERAADAWRAYYEWLPRGRHAVEYTLRLNASGRFQLPPTQIEAMYAPEVFGASPNAAIEVRR